MRHELHYRTISRRQFWCVFGLYDHLRLPVDPLVYTLSFSDKHLANFFTAEAWKAWWAWVGPNHEFRTKLRATIGASSNCANGDMHLGMKRRIETLRFQRIFSIKRRLRKFFSLGISSSKCFLNDFPSETSTSIQKSNSMFVIRDRDNGDISQFLFEILLPQNIVEAISTCIWSTQFPASLADEQDTILSFPDFSGFNSHPYPGGVDSLARMDNQPDSIFSLTAIAHRNILKEPYHPLLIQFQEHDKKTFVFVSVCKLSDEEMWKLTGNYHKGNLGIYNPCAAHPLTRQIKFKSVYQFICSPYSVWVNRQLCVQPRPATESNCRLWQKA